MQIYSNVVIGICDELCCSLCMQTMQQLEKKEKKNVESSP